jgi:hypothetical protein
MATRRHEPKVRPTGMANAISDHVPEGPTFSPSEAAIEGFRILGRHWRVVVGWAGFQIVAMVALCILMFLVLFAVVPFAGSREAAGNAGAAIGGLLLGLGGGVIEIVIICGLFRLLLRPDEPGFLHLRAGRDEARVFGAGLLLVLIALPVLVAGGLLVAALGHVSALFAIIAAPLVLVACYALLLRFGLTPVIAFAERRISPVAAWRRSRGQTWRLLGMALLQICLIALMAVLMWLVLFIASGLLTGFDDLNLTDAETLSAHPGRLVLQVLTELVLVPVFIVIGQTPWVSAYAALRGGEP